MGIKKWVLRNDVDISTIYVQQLHLAARAEVDQKLGLMKITSLPYTKLKVSAIEQTINN